MLLSHRRKWFQPSFKITQDKKPKAPFFMLMENIEVSKVSGQLRHPSLDIIVRDQRTSSLTGFAREPTKIDCWFSGNLLASSGNNRK